jgi:hypothetical protein
MGKPSFCLFCHRQTSEVHFPRCRFSPVAFQFERKGRIQVTVSPESTQDADAFFEQLFEAAAESGAEDVKIAEQEEEKVEEVIYEVCLPSSSHGSPSYVPGFAI